MVECRTASKNVVVCFLAVLLAACGLSGPAYNPPPQDVDVVVEMTTLLNYSPDEITIRAGDTVEWRNVSIMGHTVTADPDLAEDATSVALPQGAETFNSGNIEPGEVYRRTFDVAGEYTYFCIPHEEQAMVAKLTVLPAGAQ